MTAAAARAPVPQVFDNARPTPGLQAHTVISRFVDHIPYYRQAQISVRFGTFILVARNDSRRAARALSDPSAPTGRCPVHDAEAANC